MGAILVWLLEHSKQIWTGISDFFKWVTSSWRNACFFFMGTTFLFAWLWWYHPRIVKGPPSIPAIPGVPLPHGPTVQKTPGPGGHVAPDSNNGLVLQAIIGATKLTIVYRNGSREEFPKNLDAKVDVMADGTFTIEQYGFPLVPKVGVSYVVGDKTGMVYGGVKAAFYKDFGLELMVSQTHAFQGVEFTVPLLNTLTVAAGVAEPYGSLTSPSLYGGTSARLLQW